MPTGMATRAPATEKNQVPRALHGHGTVFTGRSKQIRIIVLTTQDIKINHSQIQQQSYGRLEMTPNMSQR